MTARLLGSRRIGSVASAALLASLPALAGADDLLDIKALTLEQLLDINVYSASRKLEPVRTTANAAYVLTSDDIRRARVTNIPDALRLVPGVQVARIDASKWAVSIRGFVFSLDTRTANKLLVLVDGRSIYDPLFSGVLWESRDVMLEDVDRIEVIRGPGGTLWGSNAVNGVINIITKKARDTQGGLVVAGGGTEERALAAARYGWRPSRDSYARVYAKTTQRDEGFSVGRPAEDDYHMAQGGFRLDWDPTSRDRFVFSGDVYGGEAGEPTATGSQDVGHRGSNVAGRWQRALTADSELRVQFYYDRIDLANENLSEDRDTYDLEIQHTFRPSRRQEVVWGIGHRQSRDDTVDGAVFRERPIGRTLQWTNLFVQDGIVLVPDRWRLTLGAKVERNEYTGNEWQPSVRLAYTPDTRQTYWTGVSRAVRTPSRLEADLMFGGRQIGADLAVEELIAYEAGYRIQVNPRWSWDIATFYNVYDNLFTIENQTDLAAVRFGNNLEGITYGGELSVRWQARPDVRLEAAYTLLEMDMDLKSGSDDLGRPGNIEGSNPRHQLALRGNYDLTRRWELDSTVRYVSELTQPEVSAYTELDLGVAWHPNENLELALVGQNLLDAQHPEQASSIATQVQRGMYGKMSWRF